MSTYVLNKQEYDGHHEVHDAEAHCDSDTYPRLENQISLGWQFDCEDAIDRAESLYPSWDIDGCYHCTNCHTK